jgi:hypothetical protein
VLSKAEFAAVSAFFVAFVILAVFVYNGTRTAKMIDIDTEEKQGYVGWFLLASLVTLWAVTSQIGTLILLIGELRVQGSLSWWASWVFQIALFMSGLVLVPRHACQSVRVALKTGDPRAEKDRLRRIWEAQGKTGEAEPPLPAWSLI